MTKNVLLYYTKGQISSLMYFHHSKSAVIKSKKKEKRKVQKKCQFCTFTLYLGCLSQYLFAGAFSDLALEENGKGWLTGWNIKERYGIKDMPKKEEGIKVTCYPNYEKRK